MNKAKYLVGRSVFSYAPYILMTNGFTYFAYEHNADTWVSHYQFKLSDFILMYTTESFSDAVVWLVEYSIATGDRMVAKIWLEAL